MVVVVTAIVVMVVVVEVMVIKEATNILLSGDRKTYSFLTCPLTPHLMVPSP